MLKVTIDITDVLTPDEGRKLANVAYALAGIAAPKTDDITIRLDGSDVKRVLDETVAELKAGDTTNPVNWTSRSTTGGHPDIVNALSEGLQIEDDIAQASAIFGKQAVDPLAPSGAASPADVPTSTNAPAVPPVTSAATAAPPAPPAPGAPPASSATTGRAPIVDSAGYEWDERIHSSSRAYVKADKTWKLKRGIPDFKVMEVRAEYDARTGRRDPLPSPAVDAPPSPPPPPANTTAPPPPPPSIDFPTLVAKVQEAMTTGRLAKPDLDNYLVSELQVSTLREIQLDPAKMALLYGHFSKAFSP